MRIFFGFQNYITERMKFGVFLYVVLGIIGKCHTAYKQWVPNANFENAANWNAGRPPCGNDRVVIHEESAAVYVQTDTTIRELTMPMNGEVILGSNAILAFTDQPDHSASCTPYDGDIEFNVTYPRDWFDPKNWCETASETGSCQSATVLETERVPCSSDDVVFPSGKSFFVNVDTGANITIKTIKITGKAYTTSSLQTFLDTDPGTRMFPVPSGGSRSAITVRRLPCNDPTGCACGNDREAILHRICKIASPHCMKAQCQGSMLPQGACCEICESPI